LENYFTWGDDWAQYLMQAKALLDGNASTLATQNAYMMHTSARQDGPVAYPWGLPLILAGEGITFGFGMLTLKMFNVLFFLLSVIATWRLAREFTFEAMAVLVAAMIALNPMLAHYSNHVMTELPFMAASVYALRAIEWNHKGSRFGPWWSRLCLGILIGVVCTIRANGVLLLLAATTREFLSGKDRIKERPRLGVLILPYLGFAVFSAAWQFFFPGGGDSYIRLLSHITATTLWTNLLTYPVAIFDFFTAGHYSGVAAIALAPVMIYGAVHSWSRTAHLGLYFLATLGLYIVWPEQGQGYRFLIPVAPLVALFLVLGCQALTERWSAQVWFARLARAAPFGVAGVFFAASMFFVIFGKAPQTRWHPYDAESTGMFQWVREHTPADAVFSFFKPRAFHLFTGRLCLTNEVRDLENASYFIYGERLDGNETQPPLEQYLARFNLNLVYENRNFKIFRVQGKRGEIATESH